MVFFLSFLLPEESDRREDLHIVWSIPSASELGQGKDRKDSTAPSQPNSNRFTSEYSIRINRIQDIS